MKQSKQKGMAAIEFIWSLPVLLLILAGIFDFSRAFIEYTVLDKAVRSGGRYAIVGKPNTASTIADISEIENMVVYGNIAGTGDTKLNGLTTAGVNVVESTNYVTVTATYQYSPLFSPIPYTGITLDIPLVASSVMRTKP
ncbi:TadE/TadG family type IV pilus assembly protein [Vibrio sp. SCSIO 43137]|uniref:TadE/TadG family type IV pilus assembly protein n=1 Tax=Vibrio sp. SCSIO 43137 TaxID=3021011 RepID=UPI002307D68C|nr:TadE/TadG family type IV pilus assembly protein [Vibrio sp. SCSIO 43137]WCE29117.1 TadE/TadG family type IV pilus assembly protein [Vibrio sp. SCSIO 43137]